MSITQAFTATNGRFLGICAACENRRTCIYVRGPKWPVVQCDEFVGAETLEDKINGKHESLSEDPVIRTSPDRFRALRLAV
jgi:hypothetical protein